ncbi:MAG: 3-isopropylmalate dehydratase large subunit [Congregibacter sp.]
MPQTLFDKLWDEHLVERQDDGTDLVYIDRVLLHERTGSIALASLEADGRSVLCPEQVFCCMDHIVDTFPGRGDETTMPSGRDFIVATRHAAQEAGITLFDLGDPRQGIVHVVSPEQGIVQPGVTLVCPDSHTCTQGAFGALAWGIGSSEAEHALVTKTLRVKRPATMRVRFDGSLGRGVSAKDMILHLIGRYGAAGGGGYAIEFAGPAIDALSMEARMTLCNMAVEFSAFTGLIAPDIKAIDYLRDRPYSPVGEVRDRAEIYWQSLRSDDEASFDREIVIDCAQIEPCVTWGTSPEHCVSMSGAVPADDGNETLERARRYMDVQPGQPVRGIPIEAAFIGSCTNARLSDLRVAADLLRGRRVADGIRAICVPGSTQVRAAAEAEGLHSIFLQAGFEWRESGCSMCFYAGGEHFGHEQRVISTTNRNFESRQGPRTRTHLASPATVAASAVAGCIADPRDLL